MEDRVDEGDLFGGLAGVPRSVVREDFLVELDLLLPLADAGESPVLVVEVANTRRPVEELLSLLGEFLAFVLPDVNNLRMGAEGAVL